MNLLAAAVVAAFAAGFTPDPLGRVTSQATTDPSGEVELTYADFDAYSTPRAVSRVLDDSTPAESAYTYTTDDRGRVTDVEAYVGGTLLGEVHGQRRPRPQSAAQPQRPFIPA